MSVLDKFLILFESDAKDAAKDVKGLNKSLDDTEGAANDAAQASDNSSTQFMGMGASALGAVGGLVALTAAVAGLVVKAQSMDELGKFAKLIGEDIGEVDAWGGAVVRAGGTVEGFRGSVEALNQKMVDLSIKGTNDLLPFFNQLGISAVDSNGKIKSTLQILPELAASFSKMDNTKSMGIGKAMGLDAGTIALLQEGTEGIDKLLKRQQQLGLVNEEAAQASAEWVDIMSDFKQVTGYIAQGLLTSLLPSVTWVVDSLINLSGWAKENKPILIGLFVGLGAVAIPMMWSLAASAWAAIAPMIAMTAVGVALAWPFILAGAAVVALSVGIALLIDDILAFKSGADSMIGDMVKKWPILGDIINGITDAITFAFDILKAYWGFLFDVVTSPIETFNKVKNAISSFIGEITAFVSGQDSMIGNILSKWPMVSDIINGIIDVVKSLIGYIADAAGAMAAIADAPGKAVNAVKDFFGFGDDEDEKEKSIPDGKGYRSVETDDNIKKAQDAIALASTSPIASQTSNSIQNSRNSSSKNTSIKSGDTIIYTQATDADGIAAEIGSSLEDQMRATVDGFDDGVLV